jgi:hypothetical protein
MPQMTIGHMRIAFWIPKAKDTHSEYVILIDFPLQQWLHERPWMLGYMHIACRISYLTVRYTYRIPAI